MSGKIVNSMVDFRRIVSGWLERYDMNWFKIPFDEFVDNVSDDMLYESKKDGFKWGDEMPHFNDVSITWFTNKYHKMDGE